MVYVTGGLGDEWIETVRAVVVAGADVVEIGLPFSDPVMDGPTIQAANDRALAAGATPAGILGDLRGADVEVPLAVMTYYNIAFRAGLERFAVQSSKTTSMVPVGSYHQGRKKGIADCAYVQGYCCKTR